jgi:AraC-like DNA-binding protein
VVARQCGFGTVETLYRAFRRRHGTTPARHRAFFAAS